MTGREKARRRAGRPAHRRLPAPDGAPPPAAARDRRDRRGAPAPGAGPDSASWWPGCARRPRRRRSRAASGSSSSPWRTAPAWSTSPSSRTPTTPARTPSSTPACCWSAGTIQVRGGRPAIVGQVAWDLDEVAEVRRSRGPQAALALLNASGSPAAGRRSVHPGRAPGAGRRRTGPGERHDRRAGQRVRGPPARRIPLRRPVQARPPIPGERRMNPTEPGSTGPARPATHPATARPAPERSARAPSRTSISTCAPAS